MSIFKTQKLSVYQAGSKAKAQRLFYSKRDAGFSLVEVLIAILLISIVFLGIFAGFRLAIRVVAHSKAKITAIALATQKIEEARNLSYQEIQTGQESSTINNITYDIQTMVEVVDDCADGTIEGFDCDGNVVDPDVAPDDYKEVKVRVSWKSFLTGEVVLTTDISSKGLETGEGKGALRLSVSNSFGIPLEIESGDQLPPCPDSSIQIINEDTGHNQCYGTDIPTPGSRLLILDESLLPDDYKIIVKKSGYSGDETFKRGDVYNSSVIATPKKKNPTINEGESYPITFIIDELSDILAQTVSPWGGNSFFDTFFDQSKIAEISNLEVIEKKVRLATTSPSYLAFGYLTSKPAIPEEIVEWHQFSWSDFEEMDTDLRYQILYNPTSTIWELIPNSDLPGNSFGFDSSPLDLTSLNPESYSKLKVRGNFSTDDLSKTPILYEWGVSWKDSQPTPISYVGFSLRGEKIVGTDQDEAPIYKYLDTASSDVNGQADILYLEPDNYLFFDFEKQGEGLNLNTELSPSQLSLEPGTTTSIVFYLESENSLLVNIKDSETSEPVFGVSVELSNPSLDCYKTQIANQEGEAFFIPLEQGANYILTTEIEGYYSQEQTIDILGNSIQYLNLERYE